MQPDLFMIFGLRLRLRLRLCLKYEFRVACFVVYENYKARGCPLPNGSPISPLLYSLSLSFSLAPTCPERWQQFSVSRCFMSALKMLFIDRGTTAKRICYIYALYTHKHSCTRCVCVCRFELPLSKRLLKINKFSVKFSEPETRVKMS